jgi:ATP-dependent 26S proteasome regulatory subunit
VIARLKEFFSDTSHRGRVVLLMMTNRPDKIDTDLKRPGRLDIKVPFFFPETPAERKDVLAAVARKSKLHLAADASLDDAARDTVGYSSAELEAVLIAAANAAADHNRNEIAAEDLAMAVRDVIPSRDTRMLEFMELLAVFESSSRRMLPERYRELTADQVQMRLDDIRAALGHRVA